jgi:hypothetical protein
MMKWGEGRKEMKLIALRKIPPNAHLFQNVLVCKVYWFFFFAIFLVKT